MKKPVILITGGPAYDPYFHMESRMLNKTYTTAITAAGGIPIMDLDNNSQDDYIELADGCIFTGTHEFCPDSSYDMSPLQKERIEREHKMMRAFAKCGKPILGICQGMQQINCAFGGDLQVNFKLEGGVEHYLISHEIETIPGTLINRLFGSKFFVNSTHNVKVKTLADRFKVSAVSPDGVIEAYEHETLPIYCFQWHPERMRGDFPDMPYGPDTDILFKTFIKMCS